MGVLLDLQGTQSRVHGERGVARYLAQLAAGLETYFPNCGRPVPGQSRRVVDARAECPTDSRTHQLDRRPATGRDRLPRRLGLRARRLAQPALAGRGAPAAAGGDALRPDPRALRRALSGRPERARVVPSAARARAPRRPRARHLPHHRAGRDRAPRPATRARRRRGSGACPAVHAAALARGGPRGSTRPSTSDRARLPALHRWNRVPEEHRPPAGGLRRSARADAARAPARDRLPRAARRAPGAGGKAACPRDPGPRLLHGFRRGRGPATAVRMRRALRLPVAVRGVRPAGRRGNRLRGACDRFEQFVAGRARRRRGGEVRSVRGRVDPDDDRSRARGAGVARTLARDPAAQRRHVEGRRHADRRGLP